MCQPVVWHTTVAPRGKFWDFGSWGSVQPLVGDFTRGDEDHQHSDGYWWYLSIVFRRWSFLPMSETFALVDLLTYCQKGDHVLVRLGVYLCWWRRPCNTITLQFGLRQNRGGWQEALPRDCFPSSFHTQGKKLRQKTTNKHNVPSHGIFVKHNQILNVILAEGSWIWILVRSFR